ncbi:MAG: transglutaminase-like domain-containing protein [Leptospirales bacterium]|nr:transglutaminase-like domain-containing protein [Leptospirales bacterium]
MRSLAVMFFIVMVGYLSAAETQVHPYRFIHEPFDNQKLVKLRKTYDFEKYISAGKTEYEQMVLLKDWVYSKLKYSFRSPFPTLSDSLEIMKLSGEGKTFLCVSYSALYLQCALSMGWTSRYIFSRMPNGSQHASVDIWSNQYKKWIYMDPTWNIHMEENNIPMSILEVRQRWLDKKFHSIKFIFSGGKKAVNFKSSDFPFKGGDSELWKVRPIGMQWFSYVDRISIVGRNDLFNNKNLYSEMYVIGDRKNLQAVRNKETIPASRLFSAHNIADYTINEVKGDPASVEIKLMHNSKTSFTPSFARFEIENENRWTTVGHTFIVKKNRLNTGIKVRTVNVSGVAGPVVTIKNK